jgi:gas vesicle structural protein
MRVERTSGTSSLVDVLDRVLDKGIVIDAWVRVSLVGIELVTVEARVVVASIATYLGYSDALSDLKQTGAPQPGYPVHVVGKSFPTWVPHIGGPAVV